MHRTIFTCAEYTVIILTTSQWTSAVNLSWKTKKRVKTKTARFVWAVEYIKWCWLCQHIIKHTNTPNILCNIVFARKNKKESTHHHRRPALGPDPQLERRSNASVFAGLLLRTSSSRAPSPQTGMAADVSKVTPTRPPSSPRWALLRLQFPAENSSLSGSLKFDVTGHDGLSSALLTEGARQPDTKRKLWVRLKTLPNVRRSDRSERVGEQIDAAAALNPRASAAARNNSARAALQLIFPPTGWWRFRPGHVRSVVFPGRKAI